MTKRFSFILCDIIMKSKKALVLSLLYLIILTACQPTPENEVVINRGDNVAEEKIFSDQNTALSEPQRSVAQMLGEVPARWEEDLSLPHAPFEADADILLRGENGASVYYVSFLPVTGEVGKRLYDALDVQITSYSASMQFSQEEITEAIANAARGWEKRNADGTVDYVSWPEQQDSLAYWQEQLEHAQPKSTLYVTANELPFDQGSDKRESYSFLQKDGIKGCFALVITRKSPIQRKYELLLEEGVYQVQHWYLTEPWNEEKEMEIFPRIREAEALSTAEVFVTSLGEEGFSCAYMEKARTVSDIKAAVTSEGYEVTFVRTGAYYPYSFQLAKNGEPFLIEDDPSAYSEVHKPEMLQIYVTEKGVRGVFWTNPMTFGDLVNESAELLPFSEILKLAKAIIRFSNVYTDDFYGKQGAVAPVGARIVRVVLTALPQKLKDTDLFVLMPVWVFEMQSASVSIAGKLDPGTHNPYHNYVFILNAIDGSRVAVP